MKLSGNTILITGGGSCSGRGLAEALHQRKNQVIIAGRRKERLTEVAKANPGMTWVELNIEDPASISTVAKKLTAEYPKLNVLINNAGIMNIDVLGTDADEVLVERAKQMRNSAGPNEAAFVAEFNDMMTSSSA